jgi:hypothetical protein
MALWFGSHAGRFPSRHLEVAAPIHLAHPIHLAQLRIPENRLLTAGPAAALAAGKATTGGL